MKTVVRFEYECCPEDLRRARILRKMSSKSQANGQKISDFSRGKFKSVIIETARYCLELHHEPATPPREWLGIKRRKQFHKVASPGPTEVDRIVPRRRSSSIPLKCFARYATIV